MSAKYGLEAKDEVELRSPISNDIKVPTEEEIASCRPCRITLVVLFGLGLLAMLAAAIVVIATTSGCTAKSIQTPFWQKELAYQIYVPSFQDSNDDGYGDLKGIRNRLDYLNEIGVRILVLSGLLSGNDFVALDGNIGQLNDLKDLIREAKNKQMSLVLDIDPTSTKNSSLWFKSSSNRNSTSTPYKNWYIWRDTKNNWLSRGTGGGLGGSAWEEYRPFNEFYYFYMSKERPMLNYNETKVQDEFKKALNYWLGKGIKGFKLNHVRRLIVDKNFKDNDPSNNKVYNTDQPQTHILLNDWNTIVKSKGGFLIGSSGDETDMTGTYYGTKEKKELDLVLSSRFTGSPSGKIGPFLNSTITGYLSQKPAFALPSWISDGPQYSRLRTRYTNDFLCRLWNLFQVTLPGGSIFYYGDEIMLQDAKSKSTAAMMWETKPNGGFSNKNPWYQTLSPVTPTHSVAGQKKKVDGIYKATTSVMKLRLTDAHLQSASIKVLYASENSIVYQRFAAGGKGYLVAINFGSTKHIVKPKLDKKEKGKVVTDTLFKLKADRDLNLPEIPLEPYQGLLIRITE